MCATSGSGAGISGRGRQPQRQGKETPAVIVVLDEASAHRELHDRALRCPEWHGEAAALGLRPTSPAARTRRAERVGAPTAGTLYGLLASGHRPGQRCRREEATGVAPCPITKRSHRSGPGSAPTARNLPKPRDRGDDVAASLTVTTTRPHRQRRPSASPSPGSMSFNTRAEQRGRVAGAL